MAKEYKILQVALGVDDVEVTLNHTVREDWNFLSCVALGPQVLCYTFWREKIPVGRRRIEDTASISTQQSKLDSNSNLEKDKGLSVDSESSPTEVIESIVEPQLSGAEIRISPRTGKPIRTYKKRIK